MTFMALLLVTTTFIIYNTISSNRIINRIREELLAATADYNEIALDIALMERWTMDACATADPFGLEVAESHYSNSRKQLNNLSRVFEESGNDDMIEKLSSFKDLLVEHYESGLEMAEYFIEGDYDKAYDLLDSFSGDSDELNDRLVRYAAISQDELLLAVFDFEERLGFLTKISIIVILVALFISVIVSLVVSSKIARPINALVDFSTLLEQRDFSRETDLHSGDEVGVLAGRLNSVVRSIQSLVSDIKESTSAVEEVAHSLSSQSEMASSCSSDIVESAESIKNQIRILDNNISDVTDSVQSVIKAISEIDSQIESQSHVVTQSTAAVEQMVASLHSISSITAHKRDSAIKLLETSGDGGKILMETNQIIQKTSEDIGAVLQTIEIIKKISSQTNLLAMNAAIEAAHAGVQGGGFSVIAEEIRKLSDMTAENSKIISESLIQMIEKIQKAGDFSLSTINAFKVIDSEIEQVTKALEEVVDSTQEISTGSDQVVQAMNSLNESFIFLRNGSVNMKQDNSSILESCNKLKALSSDTFNHIDDIEQRSETISSVTSDFSLSSSDLKENLSKLQRNVDKFVTSS